MADKVTTAAEATSHIVSGMTIGIGGWGARRKPLALIAELEIKLMTQNEEIDTQKKNTGKKRR